MESLGTGPSSALDSTFGVLFIGLLFATFLQGLLTVQTYNYYENFPRDPPLIKITVALVWSLDTIHMALIGQSSYHYLITNWGNQPALVRSTWEICVQLLFIGLSTFVCQLFFLNRIWVFSHKNIFIVGSILAICLTTLGLDIVVTVRILQVHLVTAFGAEKGQIIALFASGAAADILIAGFLCYYLLRDRGSYFEVTKSIVGKVLQHTIATGLATSALGIASIIAYFARPNRFYFIAIHFCLGRVYTNALLMTLNSRTKIRMTLHTHQKSNSVERKEPMVPSKRYISPFQNDQQNDTISVDRTVIYRDDGFGKVQGKAASFADPERY